MIPLLHWADACCKGVWARLIDFPWHKIQELAASFFVYDLSETPLLEKFAATICCYSDPLT